MKKSLIVIGVLFALAGCAAPQTSTVSDVAAGQTWIWRCDNGVSFTTQNTSEGNTVVAAGRTYRLPSVISGSGARYSDGRVEFWEHGGEAMLNGAAGGPYQNCTNRDGDVIPAH
jgi:membrane-bound inhibitor of C-type lysozyme